MDRRSLVIGFLAGGWLATLAVGFFPSTSPSARAEDAPPAAGMAPPFDPVDPTSPGRTINPSGPGGVTRGIPSPGGGTAAWNNKAIALSGSVGSGESVVYYFDTEQQRVLVYQFKTGDRGGIKLMAARHMDYDLRLEEYRDLSDKSRDELKAAYDNAFGRKVGGANGAPDDLPVKKVDLSTGK